MLPDLCNISRNELKILVSVLILRGRIGKSWREEGPLVARFLALDKHRWVLAVFGDAVFIPWGFVKELPLILESSRRKNAWE